MTLTRRDSLALAGTALLAPRFTTLEQESPTEALTRLLGIERRLVAVYELALERDLLPAPLARQLRDQEREHARGLERALAGLGVRVPTGSDSPPSLPPLRRSRDFPAYALRLEDEAVATYVATIATIRRPGLVAPLGSIAASEGAHQVILRELAGRPPLV